jgi:type I restriction enzyme S subunit
MEVRPGYKQTEVGVIPKEWEVKPLATITDKIMVGIASAATHAYRTKGIVMFRNQNIKVGYLDDSDLLFIDPEYEIAFKNKRLRCGDLLTARTGYPGLTGVVPSCYDSAQSFTTLITRPKQQEIDSDYLCLFINSEAGQQFFTRGQIGGAQKNVNAGTLREMPIPVPPLPEQRAIAEALSGMDTLLGALDRLIAKKRDIKQAAMQELLTGKKRLPGFSGRWEVKRVLDLGDVVTGGTPRTDVAIFWGEGYPWITPTDISVHRDMFTSERTITRKGLDSIRALPSNTVLVTCIASIGKNAILRTAGACNQQINAVTPNKNNSSEFLYYVFEASKQYLQANAGTTATSIISKAAFAQLTFTVPNLPEQTAIAEVLSDMDAELAALEQRREKTRALKQGMMQELLTGRTRLA